jgi:uncharacterized small protein (DUF1192 family)
MLALTEKTALIQALGMVVHDEVKAAIGPLQTRIAQLEGELKKKQDVADDEGPPPVDQEFLRQYVRVALEPIFKIINGGDNDISRDEIRQLVADAVGEAVAGLPVPRHCVGVFIDRAGHLHHLLSDGTDIDLGQVNGADGKDGAAGLPGVDGLDGVGFEAIAFEQVSERHYRLVVGNADASKIKTFDIVVPGQIQRGMWTDTVDYEAGDCVTLGGSQWCARVENKASRPDTDNENWFLTVKRGRDGKQGPQGPQGERGPPGEVITKILSSP